ncbi:hypothetical protein H8E07_12645 [bacterium]|nr:hypothetical protein [bacterium]
MNDTLKDLAGMVYPLAYTFVHRIPSGYFIITTRFASATSSPSSRQT